MHFLGEQVKHSTPVLQRWVKFPVLMILVYENTPGGTELCPFLWICAVAVLSACSLHRSDSLLSHTSEKWPGPMDYSLHAICNVTKHSHQVLFQNRSPCKCWNDPFPFTSETWMYQLHLPRWSLQLLSSWSPKHCDKPLLTGLCSMFTNALYPGSLVKLCLMITSAINSCRGLQEDSQELHCSLPSLNNTEISQPTASIAFPTPTSLFPHFAATAYPSLQLGQQLGQIPLWKGLNRVGSQFYSCCHFSTI